MESDQSDASTSAAEDGGSEFDSSMEQHEYERRRELYISKIVFSERKFSEIKPMLAKLKLDEVEKLQDGILNRKSETYLTRKAKLDNEFDAKRKHIRTIRQLRMEAMQRRIKGDRWNALMNMNNNKTLAKAVIQEAIQEKYEKLLMEQREVERITGLSLDSTETEKQSQTNGHTKKYDPKDIEREKKMSNDDVLNDSKLIQKKCQNARL
ncbi:breast cancer metastasis-suppressor 1-like protein-A [Ditylenchus destructor]|nr:breast cancer metastasis-suppressor 1-like protein-A [Ditylenchus destructor]